MQFIRLYDFKVKKPQKANKKAVQFMRFNFQDYATLVVYAAEVLDLMQPMWCSLALCFESKVHVVHAVYAFFQNTTFLFLTTTILPMQCEYQITIR